MSRFTEEVQELYREANKALDEAWSRSIDDDIIIENAKLHHLKYLVDRLLGTNVDRIDIFGK